MAEQSGVQSVERTFTLIGLLCKNGSMSITALSAASGLHKTTVFRLLNTLCSLGFAEKDSRTEQYGLTLKFLRISSGLLNNYDMRVRARPYFERLSHECGETVHLVKRDGNEIVYIDKFEASQSSVRMVSQIGLSLPLTCTGVGKAILAKLSDEDILSVWNSSAPVAKTPHTITSFEQFSEEIRNVRLKGYAVDNEENEIGVRCVAAALPDSDGRYRYAFSVSAPVTRMSDDKLTHIAGLVLSVQKEITADI